jgi:uncharacterized protein (DUF1499 family)
MRLKTMIASAVFTTCLLLVVAVSCVGPTVGLGGGRLGDCPSSPNCVCSGQDPDGAAYIAPFAIPEGVEPRAAFARLAAIVEAEATLETREDGYFHAVFKTRILRFRDDFEARLDSEEKLIHVRSASRLGSSDFGVNRKRVERLRLMFEADAH